MNTAFLFHPTVLTFSYCLMPAYKYEVDQVTKNDWHQLLLSFADTSIEQTCSYAHARWHKATVSHLVVKRDNIVVAAAQVVIRRVPFLRSGVAHVKFGPLWQPLGHDVNPDFLKQVLRCIREEYVIKRGLLLRITPPPAKDSVDVFCKVLQRAGFNKNQSSASVRYFVDLSPSIAEIRKNLKSRWRNHLNRSLKHGLVCRWLEGDEAVDVFMALYGNMVSRKSLVDASAIANFPFLYRELPSELRPKVLVCYVDNAPVAGVVVSALGDTAQYLFGASNTKGLEVDAGYFVHWEIVKWLRQLGVVWYDLGGGTDNSELHQFNSGLVGKNGVAGILPGEFDSYMTITSRIAAAITFDTRQRDSFAGNYSWQVSS